MSFDWSKEKSTSIDVLLGMSIHNNRNHIWKWWTINYNNRRYSDIDCKKRKIDHFKITFWGDPFDIHKLLNNFRTSGEIWDEPEKFE